MSENPISIGIDLGTTNSVAAWYDGTRVQVINAREHGGLLPSVFGYLKPSDHDPTGSYVLGHVALRNWRYAPEDTVLCIKRLMGRFFAEECVADLQERFVYRIVEDESKAVGVEVGGRRFTPVEISAQYLGALRERAQRELGRSVDSAVITVPAYFEERQRAATREAGEKAGLRVKKIIDEPTAAAIAFGIGAAHQRHTLMVFDLGGGTFDISIMHLTRNQASGTPVYSIIEIDGDPWLGGSDFDQRIVDFLVEDFRRRHGFDPRDNREFMTLVRQEVERQKINLSDVDQVGITLPAAYRGEKVLGVDLVLDRGGYEKLIEPELKKAMDAVDRALQSQSLRDDELTAVLLVGGATMTPCVRRLLGGRFGDDHVRTDVDPMTVVAQGAAILANSLRGIECPNPECGEPREVLDARTGEKITVIEHHVNDETRTECERCGASLAAGRAATRGVDIYEPTARSLGILAVKGEDQNAFVCLIPKGERYPLAKPVCREFFPYATTNKLVVPVYEANDDVGTGRVQQGVIEYELGENITANTPVTVSFNLDRNRTVTVQIDIKGSKIEPRVEHLKPQAPPAESQTPRRVPWDQQLENLIRHLVRLLQRYGDFLEPPGLRREKIQRDLRTAQQALDGAEKTLAPPPNVQRVMAILEADLLESGTGTQLYLADLAAEHAPVDLGDRLRKTKADLMEALRQQQRAVADDGLRTLDSLVAQVWAATGRSAGAEAERKFNPMELLSVR